MYELTVPMQSVLVNVEQIAAVIKQMTTTDLNRLFELVPSLQYPPSGEAFVQTNTEIVADIDKGADEINWQAELRQLRVDLRENHPFARMNREEILKKLRQTREEVYDELYGDMYEN